MKKYLIYLGSLFLLILVTGQSCVSLSSGNQSTTTGPAGMFASNDKGSSWRQVNALPKADGVRNISAVSVYRIFEDPQDNRVMYLATRSNGMFYSYDSGITWQQPEGPLSAGFVYSVAVHPQDKCLIYGTNGTQIFKSDDCNRSWVEMYRESRSDVKIVSLTFNYFYPHQIVLAESNGDVLRSDDQGKSWMILNRFGVKISEVIPDQLEENVFYVATRNDGLIRTLDGGSSWTYLKDKLSAFPGGLEFRRLVVHPTTPGTIYWISTYGILVSTNQGDTWEALPLITPPGSANIYGFDVNPANDKEIYYTATIGDRSTFYRSIDGGKNWITKKLPSGQIPTALRVDPNKENIVYLGFTIPPKQ